MKHQHLKKPDYSFAAPWYHPLKDIAQILDVPVKAVKTNSVRKEIILRLKD